MLCLLVSCIATGNDVFPANDVERLYCTLVLVMGACFYAIVVGNMSLLVNNLNPTASRHRFKKDIIVNTIRYVRIRYTTLHYTTLHYTTLHYTTLYSSYPTVQRYLARMLCCHVL